MSLQPQHKKYVLLVAVVVIVVALDQWTKDWADTWLGSPFADPPHPVVFVVDEVDGGKSVQAILGAKLPWNTPEEIASMVRRYTLVDGRRAQGADQEVPAGAEVKVTRRAVEVVADVWHFKFVRNRGAAFGLMNDSEMDPGIRRTFFVCVSLLAVVLILGIFRQVEKDQRLLKISLSLILAGAVGNFIDRIRFNFVIDFIDWHWKDVYHWPTFNIADSAITVGVALLFIEMLVRPAETDAKGKPKKAAA